MAEKLAQAAKAALIAVSTLLIAYCIDAHYRYKKKFKYDGQRKRQSTASSCSNGEGLALNEQERSIRYFVEELQIAESLMAQGSLENALQHISNAMEACGVPGLIPQLMQRAVVAFRKVMRLVKVPADTFAMFMVFLITTVCFFICYAMPVPYAIYCNWGNTEREISDNVWMAEQLM